MHQSSSNNNISIPLASSTHVGLPGLRQVSSSDGEEGDLSASSSFSSSTATMMMNDDTNVTTSRRTREGGGIDAVQQVEQPSATATSIPPLRRAWGGRINWAHNRTASSSSSCSSSTSILSLGSTHEEVLAAATTTLHLPQHPRRTRRRATLAGASFPSLAFSPHLQRSFSDPSLDSLSSHAGGEEPLMPPFAPATASTTTFPPPPVPLQARSTTWSSGRDIPFLIGGALTSTRHRSFTWTPVRLVSPQDPRGQPDSQDEEEVLERRPVDIGAGARRRTSTTTTQPPQHSPASLEDHNSESNFAARRRRRQQLQLQNESWKTTALAYRFATHWTRFRWLTLLFFTTVYCTLFIEPPHLQPPANLNLVDDAIDLSVDQQQSFSTESKERRLVSSAAVSSADTVSGHLRGGANTAVAHAGVSFARRGGHRPNTLVFQKPVFETTTDTTNTLDADGTSAQSTDSSQSRRAPIALKRKEVERFFQQEAFTQNQPLLSWHAHFILLLCIAMWAIYEQRRRGLGLCD